jgi:hypothetical protein
MKVTFNCRFPNGRRMERVIRTQEDIRRTREDFVVGYKECLSGELGRIRRQKVFKDDFGPNGYLVYMGTIHINCDNIAAEGGWYVSNLGDVNIAGSELDLELTRFLFQWSKNRFNHNPYSYCFGDLRHITLAA